MKWLYHTSIAVSEWTPCSSSWPTSAAPGCHLATVRQRWPHSSGRRRCHGRHDTPHSPALVHSLPLSLATPTAETPSPLSPRAPRASRALVFAPRLSSECLQVCLELLHLLHPLVGRDLPEVSHISRDCRRRVHGRRDPDSGEPHHCSVLVFFLLSESC